MHRAEALALQVPHGLAQRRVLPPDHVRAEVPVGPRGVARLAHRRGQVEDDRDRQHVVLAGERDQRRPGLRLHARRVDDGQPPGREPLARDVVQHVERVHGGRLVVLVVGDQAAAEVGGDHLGRLEVRPGERRLAGAGHPDEHDERQLGNGQLAHAAPPFAVAWIGLRRDGASVSRAAGRVKTASCVGDPAAGDSGPTPANRTLVPVGRGDPGGPRRELGAVPLEPVVAVPQRALGHPVLGVVLAVRRGDDDGAGRGEPEHGTLERAKPVRVDVLDDLHQHGRVEPGEPRVPVGERGLEHGQPRPARLGHPVKAQPPRGLREGPRGHVGGDHLGERARRAAGRR